jgi:transcriptional regulator with XRE-family HTH domain
MNAGMELVHQLEPSGDQSPLARARLQRQLTVEETARRAGLSVEEVRWLEEGRVYRFPSPDDALLATLLYATALGIDASEARELAGLPPLPSLIRRHRRARYAVLAAAGVALAIALAVVFVPHGGGKRTAGAGAGRTANLPPPWRIPVTVLNGSGNVEYTRRVADHVLSLAYRVRKVGRADNFKYAATAVFFPPRCEGVAARLADELGVDARPLPGGAGPCQLYVIVGPPADPTTR